MKIKINLLIYSFTLIGLCISGCGYFWPGIKPIKAADFEKWPFTIPGGDLICVQNRAIVLRVDDRKYLLVGWRNGYDLSFFKLETIWKKTGTVAAPWSDVLPIIEEGKKLCDKEFEPLGF